MQVRCNFYGLMNASTGVECLIDRDLLEVGEYFHYKEQDYIISVVESQGRWFANVVPEHQWRFVRRPVPSRARDPAPESLDPGRCELSRQRQRFRRYRKSRYTWKTVSTV